MKWKFWEWFFLGLEERSGLEELFINWWCIVHLIVGFVLAQSIDVSLDEAAQTILLPLAGIFVGLSFAWAGNAQALLQKKEIQKISLHLPDGIEAYIYIFQLAILVILVTLIAWGLAGLKIFSLQIFQAPCVQLLIETCLYFLASLTLRECWHVVLGSQVLILARHKVQDIENKEKHKDD